MSKSNTKPTPLKAIENKTLPPAISGGAFLLEPVTDGNIFVPEEISEEQKAFREAARDYFVNEVLAQSDAIEAQEDGVSVGLIKKAGELGFLMIEIPERFGGLGSDKRTATFVAEESVVQGSFGVTFMCQTGIGMLPILYYGTEGQKAKYLPKLASGEFVGAYALTEAGSGSDALAAKTKAVLSPDGKSYVLNGSKMWITNGRWADVFTVFAKVDGDKFTAFLVEKSFPGISFGAEEKKMGIKGSSTVVVNLDNCQVPVENVLGEVGKGHKIAFNILNVGRWKLGAAAVGGSKAIFKNMIAYVKERKQFGKPIADFGLIRKKIADAAMLTFVTESVVYRIAGLYDDAIARIDKTRADYDHQCINAIEEYAIEASIAKVYGSEALWRVADEGVQALGGFGFSAEYPMEAAQRNARINRIFEGTNEINRLIIPGTLLKRSMAGKIDFMSEIQKIVGQLKTGFAVSPEDHLGTGPLIDRVNFAKKLTLYACGVAVQKHMAEIQHQQLIMEKMADLIIETFALDSALKRTLKLVAKEEEKPKIVTVTKHQVPVAICQAYVSEAYERMLLTARQLLADVADNHADEFAKYKKALRRFDVFDPVNTSKLRDEIAVFMLQRDGYALR
jgi:alkylation response protein AidB-like acyl-CoA dehydrogenase